MPAYHRFKPNSSRKAYLKFKKKIEKVATIEEIKNISKAIKNLGYLKWEHQSSLENLLAISENCIRTTKNGGNLN